MNKATDKQYYKQYFEQYSKCNELDKKEKAYAWNTAIGLQDVDNLKPSSYLIENAIKNIEGDISLDGVEKLITTYYESNKVNDRAYEADKVSVRITKLICEPAFSFNVNQYLAIHKYLFKGIYEHAGQIRKYNITKNEWILDGNSVTYANYTDLLNIIEYDLTREKQFDYKNLDINEVIKHLARFVADLWQIHIFAEGNTRTTAVFFIKYLKTLGFKATNDIFAQNSWYFRNALVRANYNDLTIGVYETTKYLEMFIRNMLLNEKNILKNRDMHI